MRLKKFKFRDTEIGKLKLAVLLSSCKSILALYREFLPTLEYLAPLDLF